MDVSPALADKPADSWADRVRYLVLEGGGGKGGAYLGAVIALEELGLLPIRADGKNRIEGMAGGSAGSITAFLLALGQSSETMWEGVERGIYEKFLDSPRIGYARRAVFADDAEPGDTIRDPRFATKAGIARMLAGFAIAPLLSLLLLPVAWRGTRKSAAKYDEKLIRAMRSNPAGHMRNVLGDPGLFPAFAVRKFLTEQLAGRLGAEGAAPASKLYDRAGRFTFAEFRALTGIDLVIAGTNLSTATPHFFSAQTTPLFPVVEAVGLSMSIPVMFKPVWIETKAPQYDKYRGWWADGGICNNLPLHAFNKDSSGKTPDEARARVKLPLNPGVLALTLNDGDLSKFGVIPPAPKTYPNPLGVIGMLMEAMLYGSTEGQIHSPEERRQVAWLQAYFLETYDLTVDPLLVAATALDSRRRVYETLGVAPSTSRLARSASLKRVIGALESRWAAFADQVPRKYAQKVRADIEGLY